MKLWPVGTGTLYFLAFFMLGMDLINDHRGTISLPILCLTIILLTNWIDGLSRRLDRLERMQTDKDKDLIALEPDPQDRILNIKKEPIGSEASE